ncbi:cyclic nucleotide-binding domain-containing protein [Chthonobacter albigriseus]|uniref:cyclic nucleotide-binding domain-containing protein n=1 Tax=Chthonobacter albigriseus TaxID=1683161 RepID=UPI0015EE4F06|nr:cyclic nucleotide-binding domain-containing protein [Chthonobacter albigriseus]
MSLETDVRLLQQLPLLSGFSEEKLRLLAFSAENRSFRDGQRLFSAGDWADSGYVVSSGKVAIHTEGSDTEQPVTIVERGALVGELSLIVEGVRPATAVAVGPVEVIQIRRVLFRRMLEEFPDVAVSIQTRFFSRLEETNQALAKVAGRLKSIEEPGGG